MEASPSEESMLEDGLHGSAASEREGGASAASSVQLRTRASCSGKGRRKVRKWLLEVLDLGLTKLEKRMGRIERGQPRNRTLASVVTGLQMM